MHRRIRWGLIVVAVVVAGLAARPSMGGWNDGSRLASVQALAERGRLALAEVPYPTADKLLIGEVYISDKPPLLAGALAVPIWLARWTLGLPDAAERPGLFAWLVAFWAAAVSLGVVLLCLDDVGRAIGLAQPLRHVWLASLLAATMTPAYAQHVNGHLPLLAVVAAVCACICTTRPHPERWAEVVWLGTLAGVAYNLDAGAGPPLLPALAVWVWLRGGGVRGVLWLSVAAVPWVVAYHTYNLVWGGTLRPLNMVPAFLAWPGSPFDSANMTGIARHGPVQQVVYALALLVGKHGFLNHNLPMLLGLAGVVGVWRRCASGVVGVGGLGGLGGMNGLGGVSGVSVVDGPDSGCGRPELAVVGGWCVVVWLLYAVLSNNYGGACCSVRWFLPMLAPGWLVLGLLLRDRPAARSEFLWLSGCGAVLAWSMVAVGPWTLRMVPGLWPVVGVAVVGWLALRRAHAGSRPHPRTQTYSYTLAHGDTAWARAGSWAWACGLLAGRGWWRRSGGGGADQRRAAVS